MHDEIIADNKANYESINLCLNQYTTKWELSDIEILDNKRNSLVLKCNSAIYGNVIIKQQMDTSYIKSEYNALKEYNQSRFCKVFDADLEHGVLIEEQISPGTELRKVKSLDERLMVFCTLFKDLHIFPKNPEIYPSYLDWVSNAMNYLEGLDNYRDLYIHTKAAKMICTELFFKYPQKMLLHGDLHHDNILLNNNGSYTIIDPKGVLGHPIFDIPRFILNEMEDEITAELYDKIIYVIDILSQHLNIPLKDLKQLFYMEVSLSEAWNAESGDCVKMENIIFAHRILNS